MLHPDLEALVGTVVHGRYRIEALLGVGGMGAVFRAHHTGLDRDVAIKILHPEIARDPSIGKRFEREATSASRLDHPNCVRVTDFGTTEAGITYLVMEMLEGSELADKLGSPWVAAAAIETAKQIFAGLEHAHHFGIVHRDLKPENVFVTTDYRGQELVKLVDFGIAKLIDEQGVEKLTRQGVVFGTPRYMSPEQAAGGKLDERTDLYAAGLILYEMLAGRPPFDADDAATLLRMQIMAPPPALPQSVPAALAGIVAKLLEKSKTDRYASANEVIAALEAAGKMIGGEVVAAAAAPIVAAASSSGSSTMPLQPTPARANLHAARSGAAWQPAGASTPTGNHQTLAYMPATRTGSHAGVGQAATGSYEALPTSQRSTSIDTTASISIAVRNEPPERRVGVWIGAAVAVLIACVGIGAVAAFFSQSSSSPATGDTTAPTGNGPSEPASAVVSPGTGLVEAPPAAPSPSPSSEPATRPAPAPVKPDSSPSPKRRPSSIWPAIDDDDDDDDDDDARENAKRPSERDASDQPSGEADPDAPDERRKDKDESKGKGKDRDKDESRGKGKGKGR